MDKTLANPPLVEAILELKWELKQSAEDTLIDSGFEVAHIRLAGEVNDEFPYLEPLPASGIPTQITPHVPRYRYRKARDEWPVIQLGPGIATLNFTKPYSWQFFLDTAEKFFKWLQAAYGENQLLLKSVHLRYINAESFDYTQKNVCQFIEENLHIALNLPEGIASSDVDSTPSSFKWSIEYPLSRPPGVGVLRIGTGLLTVDDTASEVVMWEIVIHTSNDNCPQLDSSNTMLTWLKDSHNVAEQWFFTLVKGQLLQKYEAKK